MDIWLEIAETVYKEYTSLMESRLKNTLPNWSELSIRERGVWVLVCIKTNNSVRAYRVIQALMED